MEHSPGDTGPPPRRGPSVDLDPTGIVTGKGPDRQRRQFLNYSFYRLDPVFRRLPADERRAAGTEFIELVRKWESSDDLILRTYSLVGLRADVDFMLWRIAFDPLCFQSMEAAIRRSQLGAYLSQVHSFLSLQRRSPYVNKMKGAGEGVELLPGEGEIPVRVPLHEDAVVVPPVAPRAAGDDGRAHRRLRAVQGRQPELELQLRHRRPGLRGRVRLGLPAGVRRSGGAAALHGGEPLHAAGHADVHVREGTH